MRIASASAVLVSSLLVAGAAAVHAQLPPQAPTPVPAPVTPPPGPAPTQPATPPAAPAPAPTPALPPVQAPTTGTPPPTSTPATPSVTTPPATTSPSPVVAPSPNPTGPGDRTVMARVLGRALTQDEAVAIALEVQPSIQATLFDYRAAAFRVDQAIAPLLPQLVGTWSSQRDRNSFVGITSTGANVPAPVTTHTTTTVARLSASQVIFDFGKTFASTDAARRLAEQAQENVELQRQLVTQTVKEAFTNINFAQRLIRVQEQALERADLNLRSARGFFEVGTRPKSDVARAEVDVANARVALIQARNAERLARVALNTAMGIPADTPTQVQDNLVYQPLAVDRTQLISRALTQRPEQRQANLVVGQAEAQARRTLRDFFPDIVGSGFIGANRADPTAPNRSTDWGQIWEVAVQLSWTLFDGGNRIARFREAKANVDAAVARMKASELNISRDVEQAEMNVDEADQRIQAAQTAVASAQENFRLAQGRFDAGVGTILELTDAQLALTQAQNTEAQALSDYRIAVVRLERALGQR
jgi:outer membrane protein